MTENAPFAGRVALITGGGSGIGASLARALARQQVRVIVTDIDESSARAVAVELAGHGASAMALELDVTRRADWEHVRDKAQARFGHIDILCSNAGVRGTFRPVTETSANYFRWLFDVHVMGALHGVQALAPAMSARGEGWILFTASMAALSTAPLVADYSAAKHALLALADGVRQENEALAVSVLCPAAVATSLGATSQRAAALRLGAHFSPDTGADAQKSKLISGSGGAISAEAAAAAGLAALAERRFLALTHVGAATRAIARSNEIIAAAAALNPAA